MTFGTWLLNVSLNNPVHREGRRSTRLSYRTRSGCALINGGESMPQREIERFEAIGESGRRYTVVLMGEVITFTPLKGPPQERIGSTVYQLLDGSHVNMKNAVEFEIFDTEEVIRKVE